MSDDDYYSDPDSDSDEEDNNVTPIKKPLIKSRSAFGGGDNDEELDDADPDEIDVSDDNESDDGIVGGADSDLEEGEIREEDDDAEPDEEEEEDEDDSDSDIEINEDGEPVEKASALKPSKAAKLKKAPILMHEDDDDEDDEYDEGYLHKFDNEIVKNYVNDFHPECFNHNYDEIAKLSVVTKNPDGIIIDPLHRTIPYLTKYEKARILGQRAKQIETGAKPLVKVPESIVDAYIIAELELKEKKIPFIIRRPIPGGGCEYWNLKDLENIGF
jgi:DNA-directed RNA polymerase I, II, and III subunit RPABC2